MDFADLRLPVEVFQAANGDSKPLVERLLSKEKLTDLERRALAALVGGELVPPKRSRGQKTLPHLAQNTLEDVQCLRITNSVVLVRWYMKQLRSLGEHYGRFNEVLAYVAKEDRLSPEETEKVINQYRRSNKNDKNPDDSTGSDIVHMYHRWLLKNGHLLEFPQPIGFHEKMRILEGYPSMQAWLYDVTPPED